MESLAARLILTRLLLGGVFHHVLTVDTPFGRRARGDGLNRATPLIRVKPRDLDAAGVERVGRTTGARDGMPLLGDGRVLPEIANVVWATGYEPGFTWIDLPVHGAHGPKQERGLVPSQPGLYFVGLHFEYALSSSMIQGVSRDAERVADAIVRTSTSRVLPRVPAGSPALDRQPATW
jgi:putative flavoprotein involved in K+ transport